MAKYAQLAKKLQSAINQRAEDKLLINTQQWYSEDKGRPITVYTIKQSIITNGKKNLVELFKTYSQIQMLLWLRDYWYEINGWEIPHNNEIWEEMKQRNDKKEKE